MTRGADRQSVEVLGPDDEGSCSLCGAAAVVRRHIAYLDRGTLVFGRTDWCRACQREVLMAPAA